MKKFAILWGVALVIIASFNQVLGNTFYVTESGNNTTGTTWATAWNELDQIKWSSVNPGDTVKLAGGTYTTALSLSKGGTPANRIWIIRATESGYNGKVVMRGSAYYSQPYGTSACVRVTQPYITLDGLDYTMFEFRQPGITYIQVYFSGSPGYFEVKNASFWNTPDINCWMRSVDVPSGNLSIDRCFLDKSQCSEDIIRFQSRGSLKIQHSVLRHWTSIPYQGDRTHSDLVEGGGTGHTMDSLIVRYNLIDDDITDGHNIAFMTGYTAFTYKEFSYNVFKGIYMVSQAKSLQTATCFNNTFYDCTYGGSWLDIKNNIFSCSANFYMGNSLSYCLWAPGTGSFVSGNNNIQADPRFSNPASILGADGIPFTADDGFILRPGSPAINRGTDVGKTTDICGNALVGAPDMGAYEFGTTAIGVDRPDVPFKGNTVTAACLLPNPIPVPDLKQYLAARPDRQIRDRSGQAVPGGGLFKPGVYLLGKTGRHPVQKVVVVR
jgi:hypothetical protein